MEEAIPYEEDDALDSKERVLQKYFLLEWKLVKSLLDDIVSNGRVSDPSSVYKIRSIVLSLTHPLKCRMYWSAILYIWTIDICIAEFSY